jgi:hypothetical protein
MPEDARQQRGLITVQAAAGDFNTYEVLQWLRFTGSAQLSAV